MLISKCASRYLVYQITNQRWTCVFFICTYVLRFMRIPAWNRIEKMPSVSAFAPCVTAFVRAPRYLTLVASLWRQMTIFRYGWSEPTRHWNHWLNGKPVHQIIEVPCAQCTPCKASVLVTFLVTLWDWTYDFGAVGHPLYQCAMQNSLKVWWNSRPSWQKLNRVS